MQEEMGGRSVKLDAAMFKWSVLISTDSKEENL